jgi:hypothetical protein
LSASHLRDVSLQLNDTFVKDIFWSVPITFYQPLLAQIPQGIAGMIVSSAVGILMVLLADSQSWQSLK